jgi:hypothetical protein
MNWKRLIERLKSSTEGIGWKKILRLIEVALVLALVIYFAPIALNLFFGWKIYSYFFKQFTGYGVPGYLSGIMTVWFVAMILWFGPAIIISLLKHRKDWIWKSAIITSICLGVIYAISYPYSNSLFNPFTAQPNFRYSKNSDGIIEKFPRAFTVNPETGLPLRDFDSKTAEEYLSPGPGLKDIISKQKIEIKNLLQDLDSVKKLIDEKNIHLNKLQIDLDNLQQENSKILLEKEESEQGIRKEITDKESQIRSLELELESANKAIADKESVAKTLQRSLIQAEARVAQGAETAKKKAPEDDPEYEPVVTLKYDNYWWNKNCYFRIRMKSVIRDKSLLKFIFHVRYEGEGNEYLELKDPKDYAEIIDANGRRYGFKGKNDFSASFPNGIDIRRSISFDFPADTGKINLVFKCEVYSGKTYEFDIAFRDIDLSLLNVHNSNGSEK